MNSATATITTLVPVCPATVDFNYHWENVYLKLQFRILIVFRNPIMDVRNVLLAFMLAVQKVSKENA